MNIEEKVFRRKRPDTDKMLQYGFQKAEEGFRYETEFMNGEFRAVLLLDRYGTLTCKVIDVMNVEEYRPLYMENYNGAFVNTVRSAYEEILQKVADSCFTDVLFVSEQANRIAANILREYGISADFPFGQSPGEAYGTFRHTGTGKWFALIMNIKGSALANTARKVSGFAGSMGELPDGDARIDVINVKIPPDAREVLYKETGIYPAYHMNHTHWISVTLQDALPDERVMQLVGASFRITGKNH
ncbi:MAG: MmcQ/YjbR family DNA-binding protein [Acidaminococcaceae bacterium]|nr:MmcQ/YjbR family DNA-binding protein [Acidaminococcaceae bacterium]